MVREQRLLIRDSFEQRLLSASPRQLRRDVRYGVSLLSPVAFDRPAISSNIYLTHSAFYSIFILYSFLSILPTERERSLRAENIEMKKLSEYRPDPLTREEQRDMNRQIFLNLPKTPTTPWGRGADNPMTPRTVAFTQLNGGQSQQNGHSAMGMASSGQGPSRLLPFRQQYGDSVDGR